MTWPEALEALAGHPHARRFRQLCGDDSDPERRDAWRIKVVGLATGEATPARAPAPARPSAVESVDLARRMNACPRRTVDPGCGCNGGRCGARGGAVVSHVDCFDCLRG